MSWNIEALTPDAESFNQLRELADWGRLDPVQVAAGLTKSLCCWCAVLDGKIIGFVRLVGDGHLKVSIEELLVHPDHRRQGIARALMDALMARVRQLPPRCTISLMATEGLDTFYASYGFKLRPPERPAMQLHLPRSK